MPRGALAPPRPPRGLAVDGDHLRGGEVGRILAQALDPGGEDRAEHRAGERVHHVIERVMRGDTAREGQHPT